MSTLKKFLKYILLLIAAYVITGVLIFLGFNVNYSEIKLKGELPEQVSVEKAEASKKEGRVYGYITNKEENNINGKYIKISLYDSNNELIKTENLKIQNVEIGQKKLFKSKSIEKDITSYSISIVENEDT